MNIANLIEAATRNFVLTREAVEIAEWDRTSPINDVPAAKVIESLAAPDAGPCPWARVVVLRVLPLDVVLFVQCSHPATNRALQTDEDVARTIAYLREKKLPELLERPAQLQQVLAGALSKRIMQGVEEEKARATPPRPVLNAEGGYEVL